MCCRMCQFRVAPERQTNCCCEHTHLCCRLEQSRVAPEDRGLQGLARPNAAVSTQTHTHVSCRISRFRVAPEDQGLQRFGRPSAVPAYTCLLQNGPIQFCTQGSKVTRVWPTNFFCEHTHTCVAENLNSGLHLRVKGNKALDQVWRIWQINATASAHTHMCALQTKSVEGCTQGSSTTKVLPTRCWCEHTSGSCRNQGCTQGSKFCQGFTD